MGRGVSGRVADLEDRGSAGPASGFGAEEESFEGGFEVVAAVGVEAGGCFEGEFEVVVGSAFVGFEQERVCAGLERDGEVAEDVEGGLVGAGFVAADVRDVDAGAFREGLLGEASLFAEVGESVGEVHVDGGDGGVGRGCVDHTWASW